MTNGCIIPGITQLVKSFFYKNGKKVCVPAVRPPEKVSPGCTGGYNALFRGLHDQVHQLVPDQNGL
ncbi:MAG: hypothetical protein U0O27_01255, partial [Oscillospiraceae bacterium]